MQATLDNFCVKCESPEHIRPVLDHIEEVTGIRYQFGSYIGDYFGISNVFQGYSTARMGTFAPLITVEQFTALQDGKSDESLIPELTLEQVAHKALIDIGHTDLAEQLADRHPDLFPKDWGELVIQAA